MAEYIDLDKPITVIDTRRIEHKTTVRHILDMNKGKYEPADVRPVPEGGIGEMSDGYHTFNGLYYQRMVLFSALVNAYNDKAWKSWKHEDGEPCFGGGWFIVGIDTPQGSYTYHYEDKYWNWFECEELPVAKHWDGHTEEDVTRLLSLDVRPVKWIPVTERLPEEMDWSCGGWSAEIRPSDDVLVWLSDEKRRSVAWYSHTYNEWTTVDENTVYCFEEVTHWMPLPEPPKEGA